MQLHRYVANPRKLSAFFLVPAVLVVADIAADRTTLKFLLLPPLGALTYLLFVNPAGVEMNVRRVVVCPTATALLAWTLANTVGYNAISVAAATVGTMAIMWGLEASMVVPPLALALLTILLHQEVRNRFDYVLSVLIFTVAVYGLYLLWRRLPLDRRASGPAAPEQQEVPAPPDYS
jgi:CBS-domain-containing membrane protein